MSTKVILLLGLAIFLLAFSYHTDYTKKVNNYHKDINECTAEGKSLCACLESNYPQTYIDVTKINCGA